MNGFLTGSTVYGVPKRASDIDLVILVDVPTKTLLIENSDSGKLPCRYGKLNLILTTDFNEYEMWETAKEKCKSLAPITRELAVDIHVQTAAAFDIPDYFKEEKKS